MVHSSKHKKVFAEFLKKVSKRTFRAAKDPDPSTQTESLFSEVSLLEALKSKASRKKVFSRLKDSEDYSNC